MHSLLTLPKLQSTCLIYYLLLSTHPALAAPYALAKLLPLPFNNAITAFHALDSGNFSAGVALLIKLDKVEYVNKTLRLLQGHRQLVLDYWKLGRVTLVNEEEVGIVVDALCDGETTFGVVEAWEMMRSFVTVHPSPTTDEGRSGDGAEEDQTARDRLCQRILANCFGRTLPSPSLVLARFLS